MTGRQKPAGPAQAMKPKPVSHTDLCRRHHPIRQPLKTMAPEQSGTVLAIALMTLVVLTIIGVTAMRGSLLELRMAGNIQDSTEAFQMAENGTNQALSDLAGLNLSDSWTDDYTYSSRGRASVTVNIIRDDDDAGRSEDGEGGESAVDARMANFEMVSTGITGANTQAKVHQGFKQLKATQGQ